MKSNLEIMNSFTIKNIPDLDICVLAALELLSKTKLPEINISKNKKLLVIGSGNALVTGKIIFKDHDAVFASESAYKDVLKIKNFDQAVIISASGGKHAPIIAKELKNRKISSILLTNNESAEAKEFVNETLVFPKQREPYTYNTSTYLSMILAKTRESPKKIQEQIKKIEKLIPRSMKKYNSFYIILPSQFDALREMFTTKFDELFGPMILGRIYTEEQTKHAKTIIESKEELFISLGYKNNSFGYKSSRLNIPLINNSGPAAILALGYFIIGKIQKSKPAYFKKNVENYTKNISKIFNQQINPIVE